MPTDNPDSPSDQGNKPLDPARRKFMLRLFAGGGLAAAYGTLGGFALRFLNPTGDLNLQRTFLANLADLEDGVPTSIKTGRAPVLVTRQGEDAFVMSSHCPHLGCTVAVRDEDEASADPFAGTGETDYFCYCHNGQWTPDGTPIGGPVVKMGPAGRLHPLQFEIEDGEIYAWV